MKSSRHRMNLALGNILSYLKLVVRPPRRDEEIPAPAVEPDAVAAHHDVGRGPDGVGAARVPELHRVVPPGGDELVGVQLQGTSRRENSYTM